MDNDFALDPISIGIDELAHRQLVNQLPIGLVLYNDKGTILRANYAASRILRCDLENLIGKKFNDPSWCFLNENREIIPVSHYPVSRVLSTKNSVENLILGIQRVGDNRIIWAICWAYPVCDSQGILRQISLSLNDITHIRKLTEDLSDREALFRALFDHSMDAVLLITPDDGDVVAANPAACSMFQRSESEIRIVGRHGLIDWTDPRSKDLARKHAKEGKVFGVLRMIKGNSSTFEAEISSSIYHDSCGKKYSSMIVRDITERVAISHAMEASNQQLRYANDKLARIAHYDLLTQLPNRILLSERLRQAIANADKSNWIVGVVFIDLDGFKSINDRFGHFIGDQTLMHMARRLNSAIRDGDTLARVGGDEFVAVVSGLKSINELELLMQRLQMLAAEPVNLKGLTMNMSASIGFTTYPMDASGAEQLLRHADQAMYLAKQAGKNQYYMFDVASDTAVRARNEEFSAILRGFHRGEFVLYYQPEVELTTGKLIGAEALVRWEHPTLGLIGPEKFLYLINDHEVALDMGYKIIDLALTQIEIWQSIGCVIPVSVNLFTRQLQDTNFVAQLAKILARHPTVSPKHLLLEVVETKALEDVIQASIMMRACIRMGVSFALDDFGTGYSSLIYLKTLPASQLKIDRGFVRDMLDDEDDLRIVQEIIGLARKFGREVIAEGVESAAHGRLLLSLGCKFGQGYGISRPMPAKEFPGWLTLWNERQPWLN